MRRLGLEREVVDQAVYESSVRRFREAGIVMPTFAQLADPCSMPADLLSDVAQADADAPDPRNLFRAHWHNDFGESMPVPLPAHVVLPPELTGVPSPIVVLLGDRFPMIHSHKLIAAYGCLAPRIVTGQFDPATQRAVWPSTGNYCRGGVAVSRIMQAHGVAVLPEGMSQERFDWLASWVTAPGRHHPHTRHRVEREGDLRQVRGAGPDPQTVIFNQFSEFGNHIGHFYLTGAAIGRVFDSLAERTRSCACPSSPRPPARPVPSPRATTSRRSTAPASPRSRRSSAPRCCTTASASTTSRASATSTCRSSTTP